MAIKSKILKITLIVLACIVLIPVLLVVVSLIWTAVTDPLTCLEEGCYASSQTAQYEDESRGIFHSITDFPSPLRLLANRNLKICSRTKFTVGGASSVSKLPLPPQ